LHKTLANDAVAALFYVANFRFATQAVEYFRPLGEAPSLVLHFWSLSIEEQFYIVWPLLLGMVAVAFPRRVARNAVLILGLVWLASLAAALAMVRYNQPLAFFHTGARCWQLATGGLLAAAHPLVATLSPRWRSLATWSGLAGIALSIVGFDDRLAYPGAWVLLPTLSTAAVIASGRAHHVLGLPALQWLGARSYSWYLWHWPLILTAVATFPEHSKAALFSLPVSLAIAAVVYKYVENPIRHGERFMARPARTMAIGAAGAAAVLIACGAFLVTSLLTPPTAMEVRLAAAASDLGRNYKDKCHLPFHEVTQLDCAYGTAHAPRRAVLFGDQPCCTVVRTAGTGRECGWLATACVDEIRLPGGGREDMGFASQGPVSAVRSMAQRGHGCAHRARSTRRRVHCQLHRLFGSNRRPCNWGTAIGDRCRDSVARGVAHDPHPAHRGWDRRDCHSRYSADAA
jgi:peptidoglycan/LPS O-acetylase OafA/YrhL